MLLFLAGRLCTSTPLLPPSLCANCVCSFAPPGLRVGMLDPCRPHSLLQVVVQALLRTCPCSHIKAMFSSSERFKPCYRSQTNHHGMTYSQNVSCDREANTLTCTNTCRPATTHDMDLLDKQHLACLFCMPWQACTYYGKQEDCG